LLIVRSDRKFVTAVVSIQKSSRSAMRQRQPATVRNGLHRRRVGAAVVLMLAVSVFALGGCSVPVADLPVIGLPTGAPARPAEATAYPAVHDLPAPRAEPVLDPAEQAKMENDLKTARDRQLGAAGQSSKASNKSPDTSADQ
jgi:hypothetical protein